MKKIATLFFITLMVVVTTTACSTDGTRKLFTTEYEIEDYCENAIIVSKSNGKLFGLVNNKGDEVFPLEYDKLYFVNKENYVYGFDDDIYVCALSEGTYSVFDIYGKVLFETDNPVYSTYLSSKNESRPFFQEPLKNENKTKVYDENGNFLAVVEGQNVYVNKMSGKEKIEQKNNLKYIGERYYLRKPYGIKENSLYLKDFDGNTLETFDITSNFWGIEGVVDYYTISNKEDDSLILIMEHGAYVNSKNRFNTITISATGEITIEETPQGITEAYDVYRQIYDKNNYRKKYNLYENNSVWSLEDLEGNSLYGEKYSEKRSIEGENNCVALANQENMICIISRNGSKYIDFGKLKLSDGTIYYTIDKENSAEVSTVYEGKNSIILPIVTQNGYDIYYYDIK